MNTNTLNILDISFANKYIQGFFQFHTIIFDNKITIKFTQLFKI